MRCPSEPAELFPCARESCGGPVAERIRIDAGESVWGKTLLDVGVEGNREYFEDAGPWLQLRLVSWCFEVVGEVARRASFGTASILPC